MRGLQITNCKYSYLFLSKNEKKKTQRKRKAEYKRGTQREKKTQRTLH